MEGEKSANSTNAQLTLAEQLLNKGQLKEALQVIENLKEEDPQTFNNCSRCQLLECRLLTDLARFEEALDLGKMLYQKSQEKEAPLLKIDALVNMARILFYLGKLEEGFDLILEGEQVLKTLDQEQSVEIIPRRSYLKEIKGRLYLSKGEFDHALKCTEQSLILWEKIDNKRHIAMTLNNLGTIYTRKGDLDQALAYYQQSLVICEELQNNFMIATTVQNIGNIHIRKGNYTQALECYQQCLRIDEEIGNKQNIAASLTSIGNVLYYKGEHKEALDYYQRSLKLYKKVGSKENIAICLYSLGLVYSAMCDFDRALEHFDQSLTLRKELGSEYYISFCLRGIGIIYQLKGNLDRALNYFEQSLAISEKLGNKRYLAWDFYYLGKTYEHKGELDVALKYYQKSLTFQDELGEAICIALSLDRIGIVHQIKGDLKQARMYSERSLKLKEEIGNNLQTSYTLFHLVSIAIDQNSLDYAQQHLQKLQKINNQEDNKAINQLSRLAEALVLLTERQVQDGAKSKELLEQIVKEDIVDHEITIFALLKLCDIYLEDLTKSVTQESLEETQLHIAQLFTIARKQASSLVLSGAYILQAKGLIIELRQVWSFEKLQELQAILQQLQQLAELKQLFVILAQAHILLAVFFMLSNSFEEAKKELQLAQEIIDDKELLKERQKLEETTQRIKTFEATYLEVLDETIDKRKQALATDYLEQDFMNSLDVYLQTIKTSLVLSEK